MLRIVIPESGTRGNPPGAKNRTEATSLQARTTPETTKSKTTTTITKNGDLCDHG